MATTTTAHAMIIVAVLVAMMTPATARPMTAPMLINTAGKDDDAFASAMKVLEGGRHARAADSH
eukprot:1598843-Pyramimonas_sp.AAC.1